MECKRKASNSNVVYSQEELLGEHDLVPLAFDTRPDRRRRQIRQNEVLETVTMRVRALLL